MQCLVSRGLWVGSQAWYAVSEQGPASGWIGLVLLGQGGLEGYGCMEKWPGGANGKEPYLELYVRDTVAVGKSVSSPWNPALSRLVAQYRYRTSQLKTKGLQ